MTEVQSVVEVLYSDGGALGTISARLSRNTRGDWDGTLERRPADTLTALPTLGGELAFRVLETGRIGRAVLIGALPREAGLGCAILGVGDPPF